MDAEHLRPILGRVHWEEFAVIYPGALGPVAAAMSNRGLMDVDVPLDATLAKQLVR